MTCVSDDKRETFDKCCNGELPPDNDEVLELLSSYKCYRISNAENIKLIFSELAHRSLLDPSYSNIKAFSPISVCRSAEKNVR